MKTLFLIAVLLLTPQVVFADAAKQAKLAEEIFSVMGTEQQMKSMFDQMEKMQLQQLQQTVGKDDMADAVALSEKVNAFVKENFTWDKLKGKYVQIYTELFTEEELTGILAFYKSPVGKSFIDKTPELMTRSMKVSQGIFMEMQPQMEAMVKQEIARMEEAKKARKASEKPAAPSVK